MRKCEPKFSEWLKEHGVGGGDDGRKYLLHSPDGDRKLISKSDLKALCKKYFDEMYWAAEHKLLEGESVMTQDGCFSVEVLDSDLNVIAPKKMNKTS